MPLFIPNQAPSPFFSQRRKGNLPGQNGRNNRPGGDTLHLYPLDVAPAQTGRRAQPNRRQPERQMRAPTSPLAHGNASPLARPEYTMAPPVMHNNIAPKVPQNALGQTPPHSSSSSTSSDTPPSPQQAANQFRRTNKGLPDGVRYEPLDEDTMRLLREHGHLPPVPETQDAQPPMQQPLAPVSAHIPPPSPLGVPLPQQTAASIPQLTAPEMEPIIKIIKELIQDERNAHIFYSHLAKSAMGQPIEPALTNIASDSVKHTQKFTHILTSQFNSSFEPAEAEINTGLEIKDALTLALQEENASLRTLAELHESVANTESERVIQRIINKKIANYNQLERLFALT
ncbi:MAG: hypothetical protein FWC92_07460 [Defluviitaleaceae bacterium]|nr:hypothetical protein [Defluviitaleaceae bacterium]